MSYMIEISAPAVHDSRGEMHEACIIEKTFQDPVTKGMKTTQRVGLYPGESVEYNVFPGVSISIVHPDA